jgi:hypothetical protein
MHKLGYVHRDIKLNNFVCGHIENMCTPDYQWGNNGTAKKKT